MQKFHMSEYVEMKNMKRLPICINVDVVRWVQFKTAWYFICRVRQQAMRFPRQYEKHFPNYMITYVEMNRGVSIYRTRLRSGKCLCSLAFAPMMVLNFGQGYGYFLVLLHASAWFPKNPLRL